MRVGIDLLHTKSFTLVVCLCIWSVRKTAELDGKGLRGCDCTVGLHTETFGRGSRAGSFHVDSGACMSQHP